MISRYVKDESAGSEKATALEVVKKPKKSKSRVKKQNMSEQNAAILEIKPEVPETISATPEVKDESFTISIKKTVSGEDAQFFLNGVGNTLLKGQKYAIEVKIVEV
ncbi:MAG: hypothetical protein A2Y21_02190 [Clostridiales bacterium GWC2_40_7]|nr:MAG: hypothetical protein A2Y21_02190 [Clostridiales bacterium GWC2_40_7]